MKINGAKCNFKITTFVTGKPKPPHFMNKIKLYVVKSEIM